MMGEIEEKYVLEKLCEDFTAVYHIELNSGRFDTLKLGKNTNAIKILGGNRNKFKHFDEYAMQYGREYIADEDREEFNDWFTCENLKKRLWDTDRITYHYKSIPNGNSQKFFEAQAVKVHVDEERFLVLMSFRYVDNILNKEKEIQEKLQEALDEARLNSEIISAIAKPYQYISRIDLEADLFEEISNRDEIHRPTGVSGGASENAVNKCRRTVAEEDQERLLEFLDLSTLPERMKDEDMIEMEYRMKDGNWHSLHFIVKKRNESGRVTHVLCAVRMISAAKKREQNLLNLAEEAKRDAAYKTRFLSNMSHDIRTPVNGIIGMVNLADHYPNDLEIQQKCRDKVIESANYLVSMVEDILAMSKLEAGDTENYEMSFDLTELLNSANTKAQIKAVEKNVNYVVDWGKADFKHQYLIGNPMFVERILHNLADNAIKFNRPGGSVHVWCKEESSAEERTLFEFGCSDNGIGMSEEFLPHAFEKFTQENESSRTKYEGTGLGLAIAKQLVDKLGGTLEIKSQKGVGTTCIVRLPFKIGKETGIKKHIANESVSVAGLRALVVEDNELNMEIVKFMLEKNGIKTVCAVDGLEAVEIFEKSEPYFFDVIFMDIMMPRLNGLDATRKIRSLKRPDAGKVPVIAMSANAFTDDIINSRISGMNVHLAKPLDEGKIVSAIKECMVM